MSNYQERDQSGTIFPNGRKERENQPDFTGKAIVNGTPVYVSGWHKEGGRISLAFKNREAGAFDGKNSGGGAGGGNGQLDEDVPFAPSMI